MKRKTDNEYREELKQKRNDEYELLEEYKNSYSKILVRHKACGYEWKVNPMSLLHGRSSCPKCSNHLLSFSEVSDILKNKNISIVSEKNEYKNMNSVLFFKCDKCGYTWKTKLSNIIYNNTGCVNCVNIKKRKTPEQFKIEFDNINKTKFNNEYELLSDYVNSNTKIKILHKPCGNISEKLPFDFLSGKGCSKCNNNLTNSSLLNINIDAENGIKEFIINLGLNISDSNEKLYIPNKNLEISILKLNQNNMNSSKNKMNAANKKGIRLIQIFEDEYYEHKDIVLNKLKHILGKDTSEKAYGRLCEVKEISSDEKNKFLNTYHIQGTDNSTIYLGLYYKNILVSVMTFSNSRMGIGKRKKVSNVYELVRYATNSNFIVIGGFGKLLKYFETKYKPTELYSYADLRWCDKDNNIYIKNNFVLSHINRPNYWYCYGKKRYHRTAFMKCNLKNKFPDLYDESLSEKEIMSKTAFFRVYDCGTAVFIKKY